MMPTKYVKIVTRRFVCCPNCGGSTHGVEHLLDSVREHGDITFGPWPCEECDHDFFGEVTVDQDVVIRKVVKSRVWKVFVLLRFRDLWVVVRGRNYPDAAEDSWDYFYHSHECPVNIMKDVVDVYDAEVGSDPHGVFRYVAEIAATKEIEKTLDEGCMTLESVFRLFDTDGKEAPTRWPERDHGVIPWIAELQRQAEKERSPDA